MTRGDADKLLNTFLLFLIVSLVGNSCADFAIIWHAVAQLGNPKAGTTALLSSFYLGQSTGVVLLAPLLSTLLDRLPKRASSIGLDLIYGLFLGGILALSLTDRLTAGALFPFALVTAALGSLHRNTVAFGALKSLSVHLDVTSLVSKFSAASFFTLLAGSAIAGFAYHWVGLAGCLTIAILSFVPMPFVYLKLFPAAKTEPPKAFSGSYLRDLAEGIRFILGDRVLISISSTVSIWNIASNIFPGIVGIAFQKVLPGRTDLASLAVSGSILAGVIAFKPLQSVARSVSVRWMLPASIIAPVLMLVLCALFPNPTTFTIAFTLHCCGASLINILSGGARLARVPAHLTARVNTAHSSITHLGQAVGATLLIPAVQTDLSRGALLIMASFILSSALAYFLLPPLQFGKVLQK